MARLWCRIFLAVGLGFGLAAASALGASLSGQVVSSSSGEALAGVRVTAQSLDGSKCEAISATDGGFTLAESLGPGAMVLAVNPGSGYVARTYWTYIGSPEAQVSLRLPLEASCGVSGRVLDANGSPAPLAVVGFASELYASPRTVLSMNEGAAVTDAAGRFSLEGLPGNRVGFLFAKGEKGSVGASPLIALVPGGQVQDLTLALQPGAQIEGEVVSEDGQPISGALVVSSLFEFEGILLAPRTDERLARTDAEGRFALGGLIPGKRGLTITAASKVVKNRDSVPSNITLSPGQTVSYRAVLYAGKSISGILRDSLGNGIRACPVGAAIGETVIATASDAGGFYRIAGLEDTTYDVQAGDGRRWAAAMRQGVLAGSEGIDFTLGRAPTVDLSGQVLDAHTGVPIEQFWMCLTASDLPFAGSRERVWWSSEDGRFVLKDLRAGHYNICIGARGHIPAFVEYMPVRSEGNQPLVFSLQPGGTVTGKVVRAQDGLPLAGGTVVASWVAAGIGQSEATVTAADGSFELSGVPADLTKLTTVVPGLEPQNIQIQGAAEGLQIALGPE